MKKRTPTNLLLTKIHDIAEWVSSCIVSFFVLAGSVAVAIVLSGFPPQGASTIEHVDFAIHLCIAIGIATFLSNYILVGSHCAYAAAAYIVMAKLSHLKYYEIAVMMLIPVILGALAAYNLNRYSLYRAKETSTWRSKNKSLVRIRAIALLLCLGPCVLLFKTEISAGAQIYFVVFCVVLILPAIRGISKRIQNRLPTVTGPFGTA